MELVAPAGPVYQAGTLSGNPLAMTAGLWCLDAPDAGALPHAGALTTRARRRIWPTPRATPASPLQVNAFGSLLTPFFTDRPVRDYASAHERRHRARTRRFFRGMLARGVYPPPSQFEAWFLSAAHTARDIDRTIAAAKDAFAETASGVPARP